VPTCLWWDPSSNAFSSAGCSVSDGYTATAVTCACDHLSTFVLSAETTDAATTVRATAAPTPLPTPRPSMSWGITAYPTTLAPTTSDTASVGVTLELVASAAPTDGDKLGLKAAIASSLGVATSNLRGFDVTSAAARRMLQEEKKIKKEEKDTAMAARQPQPKMLLRRQSRVWRRLSSYTWTATFEVVVPLSSSGAASASALAASIASVLEGDSFAAAVASAVTSVTAVGAVTSDPGIRSDDGPSLAPSSPTSSGGGSGGGGGGGGGLEAATLGAAAGGAFAMALAVFLAVQWRKQRALEHQQVRHRDDDADGAAGTAKTGKASGKEVELPEVQKTPALSPIQQRKAADKARAASAGRLPPAPVRSDSSASSGSCDASMGSKGYAEMMKHHQKIATL